MLDVLKRPGSHSKGVHNPEFSGGHTASSSSTSRGPPGMLLRMPRQQLCTHQVRSAAHRPVVAGAAVPGGSTCHGHPGGRDGLQPSHPAGSWGCTGDFCICCRPAKLCPITILHKGPAKGLFQHPCDSHPVWDHMSSMRLESHTRWGPALHGRIAHPHSMHDTPALLTETRPS
jgi:hypothetical protein